MIYKVLSSVVFILLLFSVASMGQERLSDEEVTFFYNLIRQTKEYKTVIHQVDSANKAMDKNQMPQEIKMEIIKKESNAEDFIFYGRLERRLTIGLSLDRYVFQYNRRKKQIVATEHEKSKYQLE